jgi:RNA polymerase sigma factor (TIGR02999 family)
MIKAALFAGVEGRIYLLLIGSEGLLGSLCPGSLRGAEPGHQARLRLRDGTVAVSPLRVGPGEGYPLERKRASLALTSPWPVYSIPPSGQGLSGAVMGDLSSQTVTQLLVDASAGKQKAVDALFPIVYAELRRLAGSYLRRERPDHTLQSTALVHEAYLRLVDQKVSWQNRAHFLGIAAQTMRRILLDHAKRRAASKRGGGDCTLQVDEDLVPGKDRDLNLIALDDALSGLEKIDPIRGRIVEMRFFGGLSNEEAAVVLGVSTATVQRQWAGARAWLFHAMKEGDAQ